MKKLNKKVYSSLGTIQTYFACSCMDGQCYTSCDGLSGDPEEEARYFQINDENYSNNMGLAQS